MARFERASSCTQGRRAARLRYISLDLSGVPSRSRTTRNLQARCSTSLPFPLRRAHLRFARFILPKLMEASAAEVPAHAWTGRDSNPRLPPVDRPGVEPGASPVRGERSTR